MPPPAARPERETTDTTIGGDRVLTKLRTLTDPVMAESSGIRGGMRSTGMKLAQPSGKPTTVPAASLPERGTYQTKVQSHMNSTMEMMAQTVVDPKTGQSGIKLNPVYTGGNVGRVTTPLIPGGN